MLRKALRLALSIYSAFLVLPIRDSFAATFPTSTLEMLKKLTLEPALVADIDKEPAIPSEWTGKAKKEGKLRVLVPFDPDEVKFLFAPFRELAFREPGLETELLPKVMEFWNALLNRGDRGT